jgi:WD40 repeat protein
MQHRNLRPLCLLLAASAVFCAGCASSSSAASPTQSPSPTPAPTTTSQALVTYSGHKGVIFYLAWSPDGRRVVSSSGDKTVQVFDATTGKTLLTYTGHHSAVDAVAWSPDGTKIASGAGFDGAAGSVAGDTLVKVWDAASGKTLVTFSGHTWFINSVAWSPDGTKIASSDGGHSVIVWDAATGKTITTYASHTDQVAYIAWSPDGTKIVSASQDDTVQVWDAATGRTLATHTTPFAKWGVAWSPDGKTIASSDASFYGSLPKPVVELWDPNTGTTLRTCTDFDPNSDVWSVAWSPDGQRLVTSGKTARVLDAKTCQVKVVFTGHSKGSFIAEWSPDGSKIASGGQDGSVQIWSPGA